MTFAQTLKLLRKNKKLTQTELAKIIGVEQSSIAKYETKNVIPNIDTLNAIANFFEVSVDYLLGRKEKRNNYRTIPVLGSVATGISIDAIEEILDYEDIGEDMLKLGGEFFGLKIKGHSMEPKISDGDVVIVRKQSNIENGEIAIVLIDGEEATCKKIKKTPEGLILISNNSSYSPMFFTPKEVQELPVVIIGKVVELRAKFN